MFSWFKPKNKNTVVVPTVHQKLLSGMELIKKFTSLEEPKLIDFPKDKYNVFWEIMLESTAGGYIALVRFYDYSGKVVKETQYGSVTIEELKQNVNADIVKTMSENVRK